MRHTFDLRVAQAAPANQPVFTNNSAIDPVASLQASRYLGRYDAFLRGIELLQFNPPNVPLFRLGTASFVGDYIDAAPAPPFLPLADGSWVCNTDPTNSPVFHVVWTDNRGG